MSFTYVIEPRGGRFSDEALAAWRAFLDGLPSRPIDGGYQVFERAVDRDAFDAFAAETGSQHSDLADYVTLAPEQVTVEILARAFPASPLAAFLTRFAARWPFRIVGVFGKPLTIDRFRDEIGALPRG